MLNGKTVLVGITGAIAAYKVCELIRLFKKNNANVKVDAYVTNHDGAILVATLLNKASYSTSLINLHSFFSSIITGIRLSSKTQFIKSL